MSTKLIGAALCGALFTLAAQAADVDTKPAKQPAAQAAAQSAEGAQSDMRAYLDPESGALVDRPVTIEQAHEASKSMQVGNESKVQRIDHANGMRQYQLNGQADEALVATVGSDGRITMKCLEHGVVHETLQSPAKEIRNDR